MHIWEEKATGKLVYKHQMIRDYERDTGVTYNFYEHYYRFWDYSNRRCHPVTGDLIDCGECG